MKIAVMYGTQEWFKIILKNASMEIPEDLLVTHASVKENMDLYFTVHSKDFEDIPEGAQPPMINFPGKENEDKLKSNILRLLKQVGQPGKCRGCDREIYWVMHNSGKNAPYTVEGLNHFADCPKAKDFKGG